MVLCIYHRQDYTEECEIMKVLFSLLILLLLNGCTSQENVEELVVLEENLKANEFTREEMIEAQLPRLKDRTLKEKLLRPLSASFFEKSFMLVNIGPTDAEISNLPLLFTVTNGEVEITQILPKEGSSPKAIEGTLISTDSDYEVASTTSKVIDQVFSGNVLTITLQTIDLVEASFEFIQISNGIFIDQEGNEYRALTGVLEIAI